MPFPFKTSRKLHTLLLHILSRTRRYAKGGWEIWVLFWLIKYTAKNKTEEEDGTGIRSQLTVLAASSSLALPRSLKLSTNGTFCSDPS